MATGIGYVWRAATEERWDMAHGDAAKNGAPGNDVAFHPWPAPDRGGRRYPAIRADLYAQLLGVPPSTDGAMVYRPCAVQLRDGRSMPRVYVAEAAPYFRYWGVWPEDDPGKRSLAIGDVATIADSPVRLPAALAEKMYRAGESGMGYCLFTLVLADGRRLPVATGNAVDFPPLPPNIRTEMIVDLLPHVGREAMIGPGRAVASPGYYWCLYDGRDPDG